MLTKPFRSVSISFTMTEDFRAERFIEKRDKWTENVYAPDSRNDQYHVKSPDH